MHVWLPMCWLAKFTEKKTVLVRGRIATENIGGVQKKAPDESGTLIFGWVIKYQEINFPTQY